MEKKYNNKKKDSDLYVDASDENIDRLNYLLAYYLDENPSKTFEDFDEYAAEKGVIEKTGHHAAILNTDEIGNALKRLGAETSINLMGEDSVYGDNNNGCMESLCLSIYEDGKVEVYAENQSDYFRTFDDLSNILAKIPTELLIANLPENVVEAIAENGRDDIEFDR